MVEYSAIQQRGFHNIYGEDGEVIGFEFRFIPKYYKGLWFTQCRFGNVTVDGKVYDREELRFEYDYLEYSREDLFDLEKYWQFRTPLIIRVYCEYGLNIGYHDVQLEFGWVLNYNGEPEKEFDGSGLGNSGHMFGNKNERRMLLCR